MWLFNCISIKKLLAELGFDQEDSETQERTKTFSLEYTNIAQTEGSCQLIIVSDSAKKITKISLTGLCDVTGSPIGHPVDVPLIEGMKARARRSKKNVLVLDFPGDFEQLDTHVRPNHAGHQSDDHHHLVTFSFVKATEVTASGVRGVVTWRFAFGINDLIGQPRLGLNHSGHGGGGRD